MTVAELKAALEGNKDHHDVPWPLIAAMLPDLDSYQLALVLQRRYKPSDIIDVIRDLLRIMPFKDKFNKQKA